MSGVHENIAASVQGLSNAPDAKAAVKLGFDTDAKGTFAYDGSVQLTPIRAEGKVDFTGFRLGEVLHLRVAEVDLDRGILTVREGKFGKDRLVPPALPLVLRLQKYAADFRARPPNAYFFPSPNGGPWSHSAVYRLYRELLLRCGIAHPGRGKGPRIHDLRHNSESRIIPSAASNDVAL